MVRAVVITVAPASARRRTMAAPVPLVPPVTSARRPASESLMVTGMASASCPACPSLLGPCRRRLVVDDDQPHDAVLADGEVVGEDERVRQPGLVVLAIGHGVDDHLAVVPGGGGGVRCHLVADDLAVGPGPDRLRPPELAAGVAGPGVARGTSAPRAGRPAGVLRRFRALGMPAREGGGVLSPPDPRARGALSAGHLDRLESQLDEPRAGVPALRRLLQPASPPIQVEIRAAEALTTAA